MEIKDLRANNLQGVCCNIKLDESLGIAGLSGSGKSTFCSTIAGESLRRLVTLLPKSEYRFLFSDQIVANFTASKITNLPLVFFLGKKNFNSNPRSTIGTHTGIFKVIREYYAEVFNKSAEFFSFNNSLMWCSKCKGRGSSSGHTCKFCNGNRYNENISDYCINTPIGSLSIVDINKLSVEDLLSLSDILHLDKVKQQVLKNFISLQIGYLSLDRIMSTLSGGETVRVLLSEFMAECRDSLIIIDEVSIGLDHNTLISILNQISLLGNNNVVWLIDHSDTVLNATKSKLFWGPGSGNLGGQIVSESPRPKEIDYPINLEPISEFYKLEGLEKRNIQISSLKIPKNRIVTITGESGCGKSTLVKDCIAPYFEKKYKKIAFNLIGQDRNQSITSKSIIASFLMLKKRLDKFPSEIYKMTLDEAYDTVKSDKYMKPIVKMLIDLGLGYLSFNRQVNTLSTGEFQCIHLVSKLSDKNHDEMVLVFDEPSKGLSQNILNLFMKVMRDIVKDDNKTILLIEHNHYFLKNSDYVIDFGERKNKPITRLEFKSSKDWYDEYQLNQKVYEGCIDSKISDAKFGIKHIYDNPTEAYSNFETLYKGGVLKNLSSKARWIYKDYNAKDIAPIITIDLEGSLYSKNTLLFELLNINSTILELSGTDEIQSFDVLSNSNRCNACKGNGIVESFDINQIIANPNASFGNGLLVDDVMKALKNYNLSKFKFFFREIKKSINFDLLQPYSSMSESEKNIFWYGYWSESFYDSTKKTHRTWKGLIYLIKKYMRSSKSIFKEIISESKEYITCPICKGSILNHNKSLSLSGKDLREILTGKIQDSWDIIGKGDIFRSLINIIGQETFLNTDVSKFSREQQVRLKVLELKYLSLYAFTIVLKNTLPFWDMIKDDIDVISSTNEVICIDYKGINKTKDELVDNYLKNNKRKISFVYEVFGFKKVSTDINKIRKEYPCPICKGKAVLREESIFEDVDITETPCSACRKTGISASGFKKKVQGVLVEDWLFGTVNNIMSNINSNLAKLPLLCKIEDLDKYQLMLLHEYDEDRKC